MKIVLEFTSKSFKLSSFPAIKQSKTSDNLQQLQNLIFSRYLTLINKFLLLFPQICAQPSTCWTEIKTEWWHRQSFSLCFETWALRWATSWLMGWWRKQAKLVRFPKLIFNSFSPTWQFKWENYEIVFLIHSKRNLVTFQSIILITSFFLLSYRTIGTWKGETEAQFKQQRQTESLRTKHVWAVMHSFQFQVSPPNSCFKSF